jgi:hypothetical protein
MKGASRSHTAAAPAIRKRLAAGLREGAEEIENALFASASALTEGVENEVDDPEYLVGRRTAIAELVDYTVTSLEQDPGKPDPPVPLAVVAQVRREARTGVSLGTVMRRYAASERLLTQFVVDKAGELPSRVLWEILAMQAPRLDGLLEVVVSEYTDELGRIDRFPRLRLRQCVERLLAGDLSAPVPGLDYDLEGWHLGVVVVGVGPEASLRSLAANLGCKPLIVPREDDVVWGWLGGAIPLQAAEAERVALAGLPEDVRVAMGEPAEGIAGWRATHREALAGFHVMLCRPQKVLRGSKLMLLAAVLRDEGLADALRHKYILPLGEEGEEGQVLQETLRAYFSTGGNAVTAAAALGINRQTVQRRLRKIEQRLGFHLSACQAEIEVALGLEQLRAPGADRKESVLTEEAVS